MRRLIASLSVFGLLSSPLTASAAWTQPSDVLFSLMGTDNRSFISSAEVHANFEGTYVSMWLNGSQQGQAYAPDAKGKWKMTLDVDDGSTNARVKFQLRWFGDTAYFIVDSITGSFDVMQELEMLPMQDIVGKWVRLPMEQGDMTGMEMFSMAMPDPAMLEEVNKNLVMTESRFPGGFAYTLTPSPSFFESLGLVADAPLEFKIKVDTTVDHLPTFASVTLNFTDPATGASMKAWGKTQSSLDPVYVEIPTETVEADALGEVFAQLFLMDELMMPDAVDWRTEETNWMEDMSGDSPSDVMPCLNPESEEFWTSDWSDEAWIPCNNADEEAWEAWENQNWDEDAWEEDMDLWEEEEEDWSDSWNDQDWSQTWDNATPDVPTWIDGCMYEPGTIQHVLEVRRGSCVPPGVGRGMIRRNR